jgi:hypothetical protein bacD2_10047
MNKISNPFLVYGYVDPDYFCDREEDTRKLISALKNGRNITLMSPRRMGKTGLIKNAFYHIRQQEPEAACFYMDIFSTTCLNDFIILFGQTVIGKLDTFSQKALTALTGFFKSCRLVFSSDPLSGTPQVTLDFLPAQAQATLKEIFDYLEQSGKECYIAIDEFQQITEYPEKGVEGLLRSHVQFLPHVHFIFSGSKQHLMNEIFSSAKRPFYRSTEKMNLQPIPREVYFPFARDWMAKGGKQLSEDLFREIYQRFGGHTWYVQYLLNRLYEQEQTLLDEVLLEKSLVGVIQSEIDSYQLLYGMLTENQSTLLRAIAREKVVPAINSTAFIKKYKLKGSSSINTALKVLLDKEYVFKSEQGYHVYDRFMELWLQALPYGNL